MPFRTDHVGLNVTDLDKSKNFYTRVFGFTVAAQSHEKDRQSVFLAQDGGIVLTLWQQSRGSFSSSAPGLHHLSFQVANFDAVRATEKILREIGAVVYHGGPVAHAEGTPSGGLFFEDPDGIRLEVFAPEGAEDLLTPTAGATSCGFF